MATPTTPPLASLQDRLRTLRTMAGLEPSEVGRLAGLVGRSHVDQIESGRTLHPRADTLTKLAELFGVSLDWLVRGHGPMPSRLCVLIAVEKAHRAHDAAGLAATGTDGR
jgi:transcriptional regulator with XRE-family HTH domain